MEDERFVAKMNRREVRFGRGDALKVRLRTRTTRAENGKIAATYKVVEVLEYLPAAIQTPLFESSDS